MSFVEIICPVLYVEASSGESDSLGGGWITAPLVKSNSI